MRDRQWGGSHAQEANACLAGNFPLLRSCPPPQLRHQSYSTLQHRYAAASGIRAQRCGEARWAADTFLLAAMPVDVCGPAPVDHGQRANRRAGEWCSARRGGGVRALSMVITTALLAPSAMKCSTSFAVQPQPLVPPSSRYVSYQPAVIVGSKIVRVSNPFGSRPLGA